MDESVIYQDECFIERMIPFFASILRVFSIYLFCKLFEQMEDIEPSLSYRQYLEFHLSVETISIYLLI